MQWVIDTLRSPHALAGVVTLRRQLFFITDDYSFGHPLERDRFLCRPANGGKVLGSVRHRWQSLRCRPSCLTGAPPSQYHRHRRRSADNMNSQAAASWRSQGRPAYGGMLQLITDIHSLGLPARRGFCDDVLLLDTGRQTREVKRYFAKMNRMPTMWQPASIHWMS